MITREHMQEALSLAHVQAIAARAGVLVKNAGLHDYGVDGFFKSVTRLFGGGFAETGMPVEFQLKSTVRWKLEPQHIAYDLEARTHRIFASRGRGEPPIILILLCLPRNADHWLQASEDHLILQRCCYFLRFKSDVTDNASSVRIRIPRTNVLTPEALQGVMSDAYAEALAGA